MADADTRQKRESAVSLLVPSMIPGVVPTGTVTQAERQASVWIYSGILAGSAVPVPNLIKLATLAGNAPAIAVLSGRAPGLTATAGVSPKIDKLTGKC